MSTRKRNKRTAFTLIEVVLAIALSAVLLGLLTLAVDQYLVNVQSSRNAVEHAQVARGVLRMIASDLRNTATAYEQDISTVAELAAAAGAANFDAVSVDEPIDSTSDSTNADDAPRLGVTGDLATLQVDVLRTSRPVVDQPDEFAAEFPEVAAFEGPPTTSGISTVRYSLASTGGLVRQEIARAVALREEELGSTASWDAAFLVVAEEVVGLQFRYSDGLDALDAWDLEDREGQNPIAIEVLLTLREPTSRGANSQADEVPTRNYRMTVALPPVDNGGASDEEDATVDGSASNSSASG